MTENSRFAAIGECMIELCDQAQTTVAFGGDSYNTTAYLARLGKGRGLSADYITALGDDPYSDEMIATWRGEGVGTDLCGTHQMLISEILCFFWPASARVLCHNHPIYPNSTNQHAKRVGALAKPPRHQAGIGVGSQHDQ